MFQLIEPVILLQPGVPTQDELGGQIDGVPTELPTLASVEAWSGGERQEGAAEYSFNQRALVVRKNPDITTSWKVVLDGFELQVQAVLPAGHGRKFANYQRLICEAPNDSKRAAAVDTGPQPVYLNFQTGDAGDGTSRDVFDVTGQTGDVVPQPSLGGTIAVTSPMGASLAGQYIVMLYPSAWGEPTGVYTDASRAINQLGAFRFVPAEARGSTSNLAAAYTAMVSRNRKATDAQLTLTIEW